MSFLFSDENLAMLASNLRNIDKTSTTQERNKVIHDSLKSMVIAGRKRQAELTEATDRETLKKNLDGLDEILLQGSESDFIASILEQYGTKIPDITKLSGVSDYQKRSQIVHKALEELLASGADFRLRLKEIQRNLPKTNSLKFLDNLAEELDFLDQIVFEGPQSMFLNDVVKQV